MGKNKKNKRRKSRESEQVKLSKKQTLLSLERTLMGREKVVLNEITTMVAFMALGFALMKFFEETNQIVVLLGITFVVIAAFGTVWLVLNFKKYSKKLRALEEIENLEENFKI